MLISMLVAAGLAAQEPAPAAEAGAELTPYEAMRRAADSVERVPLDDSRDQARRMAGSDRDESRFFNRPGATPAEYREEWDQCRQIARRLASGDANGALMAAAFTHAGLVGGLLVGGVSSAINQRRARRDIRRQCLMARGWRMVEPDEAGRRRISALPRAERESYYDRMLGATEVASEGAVTDWAALHRGEGAVDGGADTAEETPGGSERD